MTPDKFKALRQGLNMTQAQLANRFDKSTRQIIRYETGETPVPKIAGDLLEILPAVKK
jgi:transcriptional regulator with XRE-family HTH domain